MSLRNRVRDIARETALQAARQLMYTRYQQIQNNASPIGKVTEANGVKLTLEMPDGTTQTATAAGNRNVGQGSTGLFVGGIFV